MSDYRMPPKQQSPAAIYGPRRRGAGVAAMQRLLDRSADPRDETIDCQKCLRTLDPRDEQIAYLSTSLDNALNKLSALQSEAASLRTEVEALKDKARRFKGWRVRYDYFGYPGHGKPREWMPWKHHESFASLHSARKFVAEFDGETRYRRFTIHRVYRAHKVKR